MREMEKKKRLREKQNVVVVVVAAQLTLNGFTKFYRVS